MQRYQEEKEERERVRQEEREIACARSLRRRSKLPLKTIRLQQEQFEWMKVKDEREKMKQESVAAQLKLFGDIIKNLAPQFPSDPADIPMFFESIEKVFVSVKAPTVLRAKLLIPHLSERAKSLLLRLDQERQNDYEEVKGFLLKEFQLTPFQFKSRFDQAKRAGDETWTLFCARLKNLLEFYCRSRDVGHDFERLFSLLVADRIKAVLPPSCLNFILAAESADPKIAYMCDKVANMVDAYFATHSFDGKPKVASYEASRFTPKTSLTSSGNKSSAGERTEVTQLKPESVASAAGKTAQSASTPASSRIRCFACNQFGHTRKQCQIVCRSRRLKRHESC
jgi:hypothetical protein